MSRFASRFGKRPTGRFKKAFRLAAGKKSTIPLTYWGQDSLETVSLSEAKPTGTFADGTPYVVSGGSPISITGFSTPSAPTARTFDPAPSGTYTGMTSGTEKGHGAQINPGTARTGTTLTEKQAPQNQFFGEQGYDALLLKSTWVPYTDTLNVDPGNTAAPISLTEGTVVKSISLTTAAELRSTGRPTLRHLLPLTVLPTQPPANAFRPGYAAVDKTVRWTTADLRMELLNNFPVAGLTADYPTYQQMIDRFTQIRTWQYTYGVNGENIVAEHGDPDKADTYIGTIAKWVGDAMVAIHLDYLTSDQKLAVVTRLVQWGIDVAERVKEGGIFYTNGGHGHLRGPLVMFAAEMLNSQYLRDVIPLKNTGNTYDNTPIGANPSVFADFNYFTFVTQAAIDASVNRTDGSTGRALALTGEMIGWPEMFGETERNPTYTNRLGNTNSGNGGEQGGYLHITMKGMTGIVLGLHLTGNAIDLTPATTGGTAMIHYTDRYMDWLINGAGPTNARLTAGTDLRSGEDHKEFVNEIWSAHRGDYRLWRPLVVDFAPTGQIEPSAQNVVSNKRQMWGFDAGAAISVSGGGQPEYQVYAADGVTVAQPWRTAASTINPGEWVELRNDASTLEATTVTSNLTIGPVTGAWQLTTRPPVGISLVGVKTAQWIGNQNPGPISLDGLTGGYGAAPTEGDVVVAFLAMSSSTIRYPTITSVGWTQTASLFANDGTDANAVLGVKRMGATPDATIEFSHNAASTDAIGLIVRVYRGVDPTAPFDGVTLATATGTNGSLANPPAITTQSANAQAIVAGASATGAANTLTPSGLDSHTVHTYSAGGGAYHLSMVLGDVLRPTAGAYDPAAMASTRNDLSDSWAAITGSLRRAP